MSLVDQELLTLPENLSSPPFFTGVRVTRSLVLYVCFVDRCLCFCSFSFGHCVFCSSTIYGLWLLLWYLQTLPNKPCQCQSINYSIPCFFEQSIRFCSDKETSFIDFLNVCPSSEPVAEKAQHEPHCFCN